MPRTESSLPVINALRKAMAVVRKLDSREIVLKPHNANKGEGGLYTTAPQAARPPQRFTITEESKTTVSPDGVEVLQWKYNMSGAYDAQIAVGDTWQDGETKYRVISVEPTNGYETRAVAISSGTDPNYGM